MGPRGGPLSAHGASYLDASWRRHWSSSWSSHKFVVCAYPMCPGSARLPVWSGPSGPSPRPKGFYMFFYTLFLILYVFLRVFYVSHCCFICCVLLSKNLLFKQQIKCSIKNILCKQIINFRLSNWITLIYDAWNVLRWSPEQNEQSKQTLNVSVKQHTKPICLSKSFLLTLI